MGLHSRSFSLEREENRFAVQWGIGFVYLIYCSIRSFTRFFTRVCGKLSRLWWFRVRGQLSIVGWKNVETLLATSKPEENIVKPVIILYRIDHSRTLSLRNRFFPIFHKNRDFITDFNVRIITLYPFCH